MTLLVTATLINVFSRSCEGHVSVMRSSYSLDDSLSDGRVHALVLEVGLDCLQFVLVLGATRVSIGKAGRHAGDDVTVGNHTQHHHKGGVQSL